MFEQAWELIRQYDTIILYRHVNPDGDAIGAQVGLCGIIRANFPEKKVYKAGVGIGRFAFLEGAVMDEVPGDVYDGALAVLLDTSAPEMVSGPGWQKAAVSLRLDHHLFSGRMAGTEIVDPSYESTCGMIADMVRESGLLLPPAAARALWTGMVTDSGRFRYDCTTARTLASAAFLLNVPFERESIYSELYSDSFGSIRMRAKFVLKIRLTPHKVAWIYTTGAELRQMNADVFAVSRGMVGTMSDIRGVHIWVNFTETTNGVLCEIRSDRYDVHSVAKKYGGGGHVRACGATLKDHAEAMRLLSELDEMAEGETKNV